MRHPPLSRPHRNSKNRARRTHSSKCSRTLARAHFIHSRFQKMQKTTSKCRAVPFPILHFVPYLCLI
ncbi:hypothetical protein OESDEN_08745 [Oesophagostomum dentatum]|uniref:Uncharacterized protein n=1 Tax=Oesophagostomum dentatum TaxID=61180 RepID=A0A0B1T6F9_OESDE|nr:hypothetical protein OESDEN_08745 [Oesophagostomum dentatum]